MTGFSALFLLLGGGKKEAAHAGIESQLLAGLFLIAMLLALEIGSVGATLAVFLTGSLKDVIYRRVDRWKLRASERWVWTEPQEGSAFITMTPLPHRGMGPNMQ